MICCGVFVGRVNPIANLIECKSIVLLGSVNSFVVLLNHYGNGIEYHSINVMSSYCSIDIKSSIPLRFDNMVL